MLLVVVFSLPALLLLACLLVHAGDHVAALSSQLLLMFLSHAFLRPCRGLYPAVSLITQPRPDYTVTSPIHTVTSRLHSHVPNPQSHVPIAHSRPDYTVTSPVTSPPARVALQGFGGKNQHLRESAEVGQGLRRRVRHPGSAARRGRPSDGVCPHRPRPPGNHPEAKTLCPEP